MFILHPQYTSTDIWLYKVTDLYVVSIGHPQITKDSNLLLLFCVGCDIHGKNCFTPQDRDGRFGSKVGQIRPQIGQIRDFSVHLAHRAKCTEI